MLSGVLVFMVVCSMLFVEICGMLNFFLMKFVWVFFFVLGVFNRIKCMVIFLSM